MAPPSLRTEAPDPLARSCDARTGAAGEPSLRRDRAARQVERAAIAAAASIGAPTGLQALLT